MDARAIPRAAFTPDEVVELTLAMCSRVQLRRDRGRAMPSAWADHVLVTHHPAALLRVDPSDRARLEAELSADLARAGELALGA